MRFARTTGYTPVQLCFPLGENCFCSHNSHKISSISALRPDIRELDFRAEKRGSLFSFENRGEYLSGKILRGCVFKKSQLAYPAAEKRLGVACFVASDFSLVSHRARKHWDNIGLRLLHGCFSLWANHQAYFPQSFSI